MTFRNSFIIGDRVEKYKGGYTAIGTVIASGKTRSGAVRYMVEYDVPVGLLHIHSDNDLREMIPSTNGQGQSGLHRGDDSSSPSGVAKDGLALHIEQYGDGHG